MNMNRNMIPRLNKIKKLLPPRPESKPKEEIQINSEFNRLFSSNSYRIRSLMSTLFVLSYLYKNKRIKNSSRIFYILQEIIEDWRAKGLSLNDAHEFRLARVIIMELCEFRPVLSYFNLYGDLISQIDCELIICGAQKMPELDLPY